MTVETVDLTPVSPEVFYAGEGFIAVDRATITMLKNAALHAPRRRCRLCFHVSPDEVQQEMLIVMHHSSYVRPHRHMGKRETLTVIEGVCDAVLFDPSGLVIRTVPMSAACEGGSFFYCMPDRMFHMQIFRSEWFVFLETTLGPFDRARTEEADWAPPESDALAGHAFATRLGN